MWLWMTHQMPFCKLVIIIYVLYISQVYFGNHVQCTEMSMLKLMSLFKAFTFYRFCPKQFSGLWKWVELSLDYWWSFITQGQ